MKQSFAKFSILFEFVLFFNLLIFDPMIDKVFNKVWFNTKKDTEKNH